MAYIEKLKNKMDSVSFISGDDTIHDYEMGVQKLLDLFIDVKRAGKNIYFIGNGGSAAIATLMTADFHKNGGMKTVGMYDIPTITCLGNDYGYEEIFSKQIQRMGSEGDLLVAISSSGNSENILNGARAALSKNMRLITLTGFDEENKLHSMGTVNVHVPIKHYGIVESIHNLILQQVVDEILEIDGIEE